MVATNSDAPEIEFGTYIHEAQGNTIDITPPEVTNKYNRWHFKFRDKNQDNKYVVYAIQVNDKICAETYKCHVKEGRQEYKIRAYTMSGRVFYGVYNISTRKWEIK